MMLSSLVPLSFSGAFLIFLFDTDLLIFNSSFLNRFGLDGNLQAKRSKFQEESEGREYIVEGDQFLLFSQDAAPRC